MNVSNVYPTMKRLLVLGLSGLAITAGMKAQTFTNLYNFTPSYSSPNTNSDGSNPQAGLILSGNTLYGTTYDGGSSGNGIVFKVNTDGTGFTNLYSFSGPYANHGRIINNDGANPQAGLILLGNKLYGTAGGGGSSGNGTVFAVKTDGTGFTNMHSFSAYSASASGRITNSDGIAPLAGLILSGHTLFGTANGGGMFGVGTVFAINTDGTGFTNIHNFSAASSGPVFTNSDGADPQAGLILLSNTLYGAAERGGTFGVGTIFALKIDGTCFTNLHSFSAGLTNIDGRLPSATLIMSGNTLYGTAESGGGAGAGTVFAINIDGTGFTNLHSFTNPGSPSTNYDGAFPETGLILSGNTLQGTTYNGGAFGLGVVFAVNTDGTEFTNLYNFTLSGGYYPEASLIISGDILYGTTTEGGSGANGTVFSLLLPPPLQLSIIASGKNVILTWPTNIVGVNLQSTANIVSSEVWSNVSPAPIIVNGQNVVTNAITSKQTFYRLSR
jgi:uncharacterized repeat protein (TIGR03803 family)